MLIHLVFKTTLLGMWYNHYHFINKEIIYNPHLPDFRTQVFRLVYTTFLFLEDNYGINVKRGN